MWVELHILLLVVVVLPIANLELVVLLVDLHKTLDKHLHMVQVV
jgi:hypothetical protein